MLPTLPSFELEVVPPLTVYKGPRTPERYVKGLLQLDVHDPRYVKSKLGTRCNWYVHDALTVLGVPLPRVDGWPMLANKMVDYWRKEQDGWQRMCWQDAVSSALLGYPTVACMQEEKHGHVAMVLPANAEKQKDIFTSQAGGDNFYGKAIVYGFGMELKWVEYFGCP